jgi:hypothetical protein
MFRKPLDKLRKIGFVLRVYSYRLLSAFYSTRKIENRSVSPRSSAALVSVQLTQFRQHSSNGFSRSIRVLWRYHRRGVVDLADGDLRTISGREYARALDQSNLRPPHPREVEFGLCDLASPLEGDCVNGVAGDFAGELLELWRQWGACADA